MSHAYLCSPLFFSQDLSSSRTNRNHKAKSANPKTFLRCKETISLQIFTSAYRSVISDMLKQTQFIVLFAAFSQHLRFVILFMILLLWLFPFLIFLLCFLVVLSSLHNTMNLRVPFSTRSSCSFSLQSKTGKLTHTFVVFMLSVFCLSFMMLCWCDMTLFSSCQQADWCICP